MELASLIIQGVTASAVVAGVVKVYYMLKFFTPHNHGEKGTGTPLTTDGIAYPRGTRNGT